LAGKRLGKDDKRGVLFFNSHEFIQVNKPRFFIFENVKGLLSDDNGKTFSEWVAMLGGKSVNGNPIIFPYEDSVPYHLYWKVLNAKQHGIPQNRERVFLVGIRDDQDNNFRFPIEEHLTKRLKDVLEDIIDDKYFLSEKMVNHLQNHERSQEFINENTINVNCITSNYSKQSSDLQYLKVKSATSTGFEIATEGDSINFSQMNSKTRRGRVGDQVAQTLDTGCNQGVMVGDYRSDEGFRWRQDQNSPCLTASMRDCKEWNEKVGTRCSPLIKYNDKRLNETIAKNTLKEGEIKILDTYNKSVHDNAPTLTEPHHNTTRLWDGFKIRRLTPRECFRLMDFPDSFTWPVSDSQAYKQAGNSIVVNVLVKIINNLNL